MIDDALVLRVERLRDSVEELRKALRQKHKNPEAQVSSEGLRADSRQLAEAWMVEISPRQDVKDVLGGEAVGDYSIAFQRLLNLAERRTLRKKYDETLAAILKDFRARVIIPLKQGRSMTSLPSGPQRGREATPIGSIEAMFVGHSFESGDSEVVDTIKRFLTLMGIAVSTGERPRADRISTKVRGRIEACAGFVGIFTRRDKLAGKDEWTTSAWVIEEKAYAIAKDKKLVLLKERGVASVGGLQGDYEYLEFDRSQMADLVLRLLELFVGSDS